MLTLQTVLAFFSVSLLLALAPGPDNVFVLVHSAQHGVRAGVLVVLGLCSGLLFHTAAVALGLAALLAASPLAFGALKALATVGIVRGHMQLHAANLAIAAGAEVHEIVAVRDRLTQILKTEKNISLSRAREILAAIRMATVPASSQSV